MRYKIVQQASSLVFIPILYATLAVLRRRWEIKVTLYGRIVAAQCLMSLALALFTALQSKHLHVNIFLNIKLGYLHLVMYAYDCASYTVVVYLSSRVLRLKFHFQIVPDASLSF